NDNNVDTDSDEIANYKWSGYDYEISFENVSTKLNGAKETLNISINPKQGTVSSGEIIGTQNEIEGATFFSVNNFFPAYEFSALQSLTSSFTGTTLQSNTLIAQISIDN